MANPNVKTELDQQIIKAIKYARARGHVPVSGTKKKLYVKGSDGQSTIVVRNIEGKIIGHKSHDQLGKGSFGKGFKVLDENGNNFVLKVTADEPNFFQGNEVKNLKKLSLLRGYANVSHTPKPYGNHPLKQCQTKEWILQDYHPGRDLKYRLFSTMEPELSAQERYDIGVEVAKELAKIHAKGLVHRDIKPDNILVGKDEQGNISVRLIDFGLSAKDSSYVVPSGTPKFWSPEVEHAIKNHSNYVISEKSQDVYSLGKVLRMLGFPEEMYAPALQTAAEDRISLSKLQQKLECNKQPIYMTEHPRFTDSEVKCPLGAVSPQPLWCQLEEAIPGNHDFQADFKAQLQKGAFQAPEPIVAQYAGFEQNAFGKDYRLGGYGDYQAPKADFALGCDVNKDPYKLRTPYDYWGYDQQLAAFNPVIDVYNRYAELTPRPQACSPYTPFYYYKCCAAADNPFDDGFGRWGGLALGRRY